MTITCQPMDATAGAPSYYAQNERQNMAPLYGGGGGVPLAARSGFRVGTPSNILTATSTTWTLGPCSAVISPNAATAQGSYRWATDQNITGTGAQGVQAADPTYDRKDIVYIQINDSSSGDGSGALTAPVLYAAGVPNATPVAPDLTGSRARSFLVATITVPKVGGGSPTVVLNPAVFVAAGAKLPIFSAGERALLTPYLGFEIQRLDLTQVSPAGIREMWNGTTWDHFGHSEWTFAATGIPATTVWGSGALTNDAAGTTDTGFVTSPGSDRLTFRDAGLYDIHLVGSWGTGTTGRAFSQIGDGGSNSWTRSSAAVGENLVSTNIPNFRCAANTTIFLTTYLAFASGLTSWTGRARVTRKG